MPRIPTYQTPVQASVPRDEHLVDHSVWITAAVLSGLGAVFLVFALWTHFTFLSGEPRVIERVQQPVPSPVVIAPVAPTGPQDVQVHGAVDLNFHMPQPVSCEQDCRLKNPQAVDYCIDSRCR